MENLHALIVDYWNQLALAILGLFGSIVDVLLYQASGRQMPRPMIYATLISGVVLATTASGLVGSYMGIDLTKSGMLGLCAYLTGMVARRVSYLIFEMDINLPWRKK